MTEENKSEDPKIEALEEQMEGMVNPAHPVPLPATETEQDVQPETDKEEKLDEEKLEGQEADDWPEDESSENWKKARENYRGLKSKLHQTEEEKNQEIERLQKENEELKGSTPESKPDEEQQETLKPEDIFISLARARGGEYGGDQNDSVESAALVAIGTLTPEELVHVQENATKNRYGSYSADIVDAVKEALPMALARDRGQPEQQDNAETQGVDEDWQKENQDSFAKLAEENPDLSNKESELFLFMQGWWDKNVYTKDEKGEVKERGPLFGVLADPRFPEKLFIPMKEAFDTQVALGNITQKRKTEIEEQRSRSSKARRGPDSAGEASKTRLEELENQMAGMPVGTQ